MKEIKLTQGKVALVSDRRFGELNKWKWHAESDGYNWYAVRHQGVFMAKLRMHRVITGASDPDTKVDHIDGNGLNNQDENLRTCTHADNMHNRGKYKKNKSGYKGVGWRGCAGKFIARIVVNKKEMYLGVFDTAIEAACAYDEAAKKYFGEFAKTNF